MSSLNTDVITSRTKRISSYIDLDILSMFKDKIKNDNISMNKIIELFMVEYCNGNIYIKFVKGHIKKTKEKGRFATTINKEIYDNFRKKIADDKYPMEFVLETFLKEYINGRFKLELTKGENYYQEKDNLNDCEEFVPQLFIRL